MSANTRECIQPDVFGRYAPGDVFAWFCPLFVLPSSLHLAKQQLKKMLHVSWDWCYLQQEPLPLMRLSEGHSMMGSHINRFQPACLNATTSVSAGQQVGRQFLLLPTIYDCPPAVQHHKFGMIVCLSHNQEEVGTSN